MLWSLLAYSEWSSHSRIPIRVSPVEGLRRLRAADLDVQVGLCAEEAAEINAGFLSRLRLGRPLVTLKFATSLDGRIATASGESQWITGPPARERAHALRASHDAIMVGTGTVIADDPQLTCRLPGLDHRSPVRVAIDRHLRIPPTARLIADAHRIPTWVLTLRSANPAARATFLANRVTLIDVDPDRDGQVDLAAALRALGERGITRLLVEGGAGLAAAFLRARLVDRLVWVHAPLVIGGEGVPAIAGLDLAALADALAFERLSTETIGDDVLTTFRVRSI